MLLAQRQIYAKNVAFYVRIGCVRFARYYGKIYSCHLFPYGVEQALVSDVYNIPRRVSMIYIGIYFRS